MAQSPVQIRVDGGVAIVELGLGSKNPLSPELVARLSGMLHRLEADTLTRGLVLTSGSERYFCIGFDLPHLLGLPQAEFAAFYRAFNLMCLRLYTLSKPTAAAISGHATAGGCILALCCDRRLMAAGRKLIGLNEIKLGVPVPYAADRILRETVGARNARRVVESGEFYGPEAALELGLVDEVLGGPELVRRAVEYVRGLGSMPGEAFAEIKRSRTGAVERQIRARLDETDRAFLECWYSPAARQRLTEAMSRF